MEHFFRLLDSSLIMYGYDERSFGSVFLRILQKRQINKMIITTINVYICKNTRGELLLSEKKS